MNEINEILKKRNNVYGDYKGGNVLRTNIMSQITSRYKIVNGKEMPKYYVYAIFDIVNKLTRIAVTPEHIDSWADIQGYSKLILESIEENNANK